MENHENLIGKILSGRYKIQAIVGEGGMSVVMKAYDALKTREVTIKLLSKNSGDMHAVERFTNEAKAVERLSHPNIVSVYDVSLEGAYKYIVMEYINGITLKEYLDKKGRLSWPEAVHYTNQVLAALSHAHEKGVVHRDIKPENVMLMRNGSIKVIDFGIAKLPDSKSLTVIDKAIGTVNYISPEQASGHGSSEKSDIYSTGIMLYELVTGQLPFVSANSVSVAMMHVSSEPAMPSSICDSIPKGLEQIIIKAMMKDPERRFGSAIAMKKALEYLTANPDTIFREKNSVGPDGKLILSTGASQNNGNNTVITNEISPLDDEESEENQTPYDEQSDSTDGYESEDEDEDDYDYVKPSSPSMLPIILGVTLAFFTVVILVVLSAFSDSSDSDSGLNSLNELIQTDSHRDAEDTIVVPDLVGKKFTQELYNELAEKGFKLTVKEVHNVDVESGHIISQNPLAESTRKINEKGVKLTLEVSRGTSEIVLKDYTHFNAANIRISLENMGLKVEMKKEFNDVVLIDHIIKTSPEAGQILFDGDTVTLYVSKGPKDLVVEIPEVVIGLNYDKAENLLIDLGINVDSERDYEYSDKYPADTVIGTIPSVGKSVSVSKDKVRVVISKGAEPMEDATETFNPVEVPGAPSTDGAVTVPDQTGTEQDASESITAQPSGSTDSATEGQQSEANSGTAVESQPQPEASSGTAAESQPQPEANSGTAAESQPQPAVSADESGVSEGGN